MGRPNDPKVQDSLQIKGVKTARSSRHACFSRGKAVERLRRLDVEAQAYKLFQVGRTTIVFVYSREILLHKHPHRVHELRQLKRMWAVTRHVPVAKRPVKRTDVTV